METIIDTDNVQSRIKEYILHETFSENGKIKNDTLIFKEGYFDSMGFVMLITFLEEEFGIKTLDADLIEENFESINAITRYIIRKKQ